jgi:plastocyanin domain-containing protein
MRHVITLAALLIAAPALAAGAPAKASATAPAAANAPEAVRTIEIKVTEAGFEPREIKVKKGEPTKLVFTRKTEQTCITAIDIPDEKVANFELPLDKPVALTITPKKAGVEAFHCTAMGMGNGKIVIE